MDRVLDNRHDGQDVAVADESLRHRRAVAVHDTVALEPPRLQVRGEYNERVSVPSAG